MIKRIIISIINEEELPSSWKKILGISFSLIAIIFGGIWLTSSWWSWNESYRFHFPGLLNSLWGLLLCIPLYIRNFLPFRKISLYSIISFSMNWCLLAITAQLCLGENGSISNTLINFAFLFSVFFSWAGMRSIAGLGWLTIFSLAIINIMTTNIKMPGGFGFLFLLCGFLAIIFQTGCTPAELYNSFSFEFRGDPRFQLSGNENKPLP